jgi:hypothetical protein
MFFLPGGAIIFVASRRIEPKPDNGAVTYEIAHVVDMRSKEVVQYQGRCSIETLQATQTVTCETTTQTGQPAWRAAFRGGGAWQYKPLP